MAVDFTERYDIPATASYILDRLYTRVGLQFPDHLLEVSVKVTSLLRTALGHQSQNIYLYVMADTTYGSCCVDEVAAAHVDAQCIIHYGNACLSQNSRLPVFFVFGKGNISVKHCSAQIVEYTTSKNQPLLVLFGLEYGHAIRSIRKEVRMRLGSVTEAENIVFAEVPSREMEPLTKLTSRDDCKDDLSSGLRGSSCCQGFCNSQGCSIGQDCGGCTPCSASKPVLESGSLHISEEGIREERVISLQEAGRNVHGIGGLNVYLPQGLTMDELALLWIGDEGAALTNLMLTYNDHTIVRYNAQKKLFVQDLASKSRDLMRRFYLVEKAKDANIVGIVVGTLGVAGYNEAIQRVRDIVAASGKKSYTMVMGRPNPAKLANFPECDVFVLVACAQTILLDSKEYLTPLITPFEAELAFVEGREWTGAFSLELGKLPRPTRESQDTSHYNEVLQSGDAEDTSSRALILSEAADRALQLRCTSTLTLSSSGRTNTGVRSSSEYLALRSYHGLEIHDSRQSKVSQESKSSEDVMPANYDVVEGRSGRAAGYQDEITTAN